MTDATHTIFGIRHHGPGSARALTQALAEHQPDIVLIEGPPDANGVIKWVADETMEPPVALLVYRPDKPEKGTYYPFVIFSPEWQAMRHALTHDVAVRFMDLPLAIRFAHEDAILVPEIEAFQTFAKISGYANYEQWWNAAIEQRHDGAELFPAVQELMTTLRAMPPTAAIEESEDRMQRQLWADRREAAMRQIIRQAVADGYQRIAVVCGAWHGPALEDLTSAETDAALLANLPRVKIEATWVPWTYGRLAMRTGYGAGIQSPGWYQHLWAMSAEQASPTESGIQWLTRVAHLLREEDLDASSAHVIEAVRLAEALAALRGHAFPGLPEYEEAIQTVLCFGDSAPLDLIRRKLSVGERMGMVPSGIPMIPLQRDLLHQQKRLKLRPEPRPSKLKLDLRTERHRERSALLHRLTILNVPWGRPQKVRVKQGTYTELWQLEWIPDLAIRVVEAGFWGNTVAEATAALVADRAEKAADLPALTQLLDEVLLADLPESVNHIMVRIEEEAALNRDVVHMMDALPPLARILRYGDVRQTDQAALEEVVAGLLTRICIGLPTSCQRLGDDAAQEMVERISAVHAIVQRLQNEAQEKQWLRALAHIAEHPHTHGSIAGRTTRLLLDSGHISAEMAAIALERALSTGTVATQDSDELMQAALWLDGFLADSELLLVHDRQLLDLLDDWLLALPEERFVDILPLLRRTFSSFSEAARRLLGERLRGQAPISAETPAAGPRFDPERAQSVLPVVAKLLGRPTPEEDPS